MYKRKASASGIEASTCNSKRPRYWLRMNRDTNLATESTSSHNYHGVNATPIPPDIDDGQNSTSTKDRRVWSEAEEVALIAYITSKRSEGGDGMNFPKKFWSKAAVEFNQNIQKNHVVGPAKEGEHCSSKWGRLRSTYKLVKVLSEQSGFHWDDTNGADITIESNTVWEEYLKKNPGIKGFCNKGWVHFKAMDNLISGRHAKGANAFCPSLIPTSVSSLPVSTNAPNSSSSMSGSSLPFPLQTPRSDQPYLNNNPHLTMPTIPAGLCGAESPNMQRSDAGVSNWLVGLPSPKSLPPPTNMSPVTSGGSSSSKRKECTSDADADAMSTATRSKSTGVTVHSRGSKTPRVAANTMTANALTGLNDTLGQIVPIMKGITDTIRNELDTSSMKQDGSSTVIPSSAPGTSVTIPSSFISRYQFDIAKQAHIQRGIAIQALQELDYKLGIPKQVEVLCIFEHKMGAVDTYLNMFHATELRRAWISSITRSV